MLWEPEDGVLRIEEQYHRVRLVLRLEEEVGGKLSTSQSQFLRQEDTVSIPGNRSG